ncbi:hypothetical protein DN412_27220, partial [Cupriavidus lacunae]
MLQVEASKGDWTVLADAIYLDFSSQQTNLKAVGAEGGTRVVVPRDVVTDASSGLSGGLFELAGGYTALRAPWGSVMPFGGLKWTPRSRQISTEFKLHPFLHMQRNSAALILRGENPLRSVA